MKNIFAPRERSSGRATEIKAWVDGRIQIYEDFRQGYGDQAVRELATYCEELLADSETDLGSLWFTESKADLVIQDEGVRFLFNDFLGWIGSLS